MTRKSLRDHGSPPAKYPIGVLRLGTVTANQHAGALIEPRGGTSRRDITAGHRGAQPVGPPARGLTSS